ncbi:MAG: hypothetical protein BGO78_10960 [Chloroflexi bacterium 44-23]|nr:MAG: hypothetical protein BGO78_10960 [Chloroflexi bacterium 44-23]
MKNLFLRFNPALKKRWLHLLAGLMWAGVGIMLGLFALQWLRPTSPLIRILILLSGALLAFAIQLWGFGPLAKKNIVRIEAKIKEKVCVFAFQKWSTYPLVLFMVSLGIYLRKYSPFPKPLLAVLYLGIGGGLFFASVEYFKFLFQQLNGKS